jgi:hypothetical protein
MTNIALSLPYTAMSSISGIRKPIFSGMGTP